MAANTVVNPPGLHITANNWFHEGWLFGVLGLQEREFIHIDRPVRDEDIDAWRDGYSMAVETGMIPISVFKKMIAQRQLIVKDQL